MYEISRNQKVLGIGIRGSLEEPELKIRGREHTERQAQLNTSEKLKENSDEDSQRSPNDEEKCDGEEAPASAFVPPAPIIIDGALDTDDRMVATDQIFQIDRCKKYQVSPAAPTASQDFQSISQERDGPGGKQSSDEEMRAESQLSV